MPNKSVREMNILERMHYSLSSKMFHTILIFSIILSSVAVIFGFYLYSNALRDQYTDKAISLAKDVSLVLVGEQIDTYAQQVIAIYEDLDETIQSDPESTAYKNAFEKLIDDEYLSILDKLDTYRQFHNAGSIIVGIPIDEDRLLYLFQVNQTTAGHAIGYYQEITEEEASTLSQLSEHLPVLFDRKDGNYSCVGSAKISYQNEDIASVISYFSLNDVAKASRTFLIRYLILLLIVTAIMDYFIVQRMKKTVVTPIQELNEAARAHMTEKGNDLKDHHFSDLNIHTGDEIESLALIMADMEKDIYQYVEHLTKVTVERERIGTELNIASEIQDGMLPSIFPPYPDRDEFDIYATMYTAKEVGGDFYDFFFIDDDHLALVIADVSGKGIPAALFMMASKILISNMATVGISDPGKILEEVNRRIISNNPAEMFVTVWLGILDISTGKLTAANGGHEYPCILLRDDHFEMLKDKHGLVLGGMEDSKYTSYEIQLQKDDGIFVYTDGVTEATNQNNELFGNERLMRILNEQPKASVEDLLKYVKESIDTFVGDAPQFDDITMMALRYNGSKNNKLTVDATIENIPAVTAFVDEKLEALNCQMRIQSQIDIAIDEILSNIAKYAYSPDTGSVSIYVEVENDPLAVIITFTDSGHPFDPLSCKDPDITSDAEERDIGGLGIYMVKKTMDDITYTYKDGKNILTIKKEL